MMYIEKNYKVKITNFLLFYWVRVYFRYRIIDEYKRFLEYGHIKVYSTISFSKPNVYITDDGFSVIYEDDNKKVMLNKEEK